MKLQPLLFFLMLLLPCALPAQEKEPAQEKSESKEKSGGRGTESKAVDVFGGGKLNFVVGFGVGEFSFSTTDSERGPLTQFGTAAFPVVEAGGEIIDNASLRQLFIEVYHGHYGLGLRQIIVFNKFNRIFTADNGGTKFRALQNVEITHNFLTGQFVYPVSKAKSIYVGGILGVGKSDYTSTYIYSFIIDIDVDIQEQFTAEGSSTLAGVFLDLGGDAFGARVGLHQIWSKLGAFSGPNGVVSGSNADATGWAWYVDLRYLF